MKKSRFTEEQIAYALRQAEAGTPAGDVCRQSGIAEATFFVWKRKFGQLGVTELRKMRMLEEENARLKRLVTDLTVDRHMLQEVLRERSEADPPPRAGPPDSGALRGRRAVGVNQQKQKAPPDGSEEWLKNFLHADAGHGSSIRADMKNHVEPLAHRPQY